MADVKGKHDYAKMPQVLGTDIVPPDGLAGQVLTKIDGLDYNTEWTNKDADPTSVVATSPITDNTIVRGDGGAQGIQNSGDWTIDDGGRLQGVTSATSGYSMTLTNAGANGITVAVDGIGLNIGSLTTGKTTLEFLPTNSKLVIGESFSITFSSRSIVYGIDNQNAPGSAADINTQAGQYRMGGVPLDLIHYEVHADQVEYPTGTDWDVNVGSPASADPLNSAITVRLFDDTTVEAFGFSASLPPNIRDIVVKLKARALAAPAGTQVAKMRLHFRAIPNDGPPDAWQSVALNDVVIVSNANFQYIQTESSMAAFGISPTNSYQWQLSRDAGNASDTLVGDLAVFKFELVFR